MYLLANFMLLTSSALFSFVAEPQREFPPVISNAFFISFIELFSSRICFIICFYLFGKFFLCSLFLSLSLFKSLCEVSFWHYFEFSTCLITILCDFKMGFWIIALSFLWFHVTVFFFIMINELLLSQCIWNNKYHFYLCKSLFILILIITYW